MPILIYFYEFRKLQDFPVREFFSPSVFTDRYKKHVMIYYQSVYVTTKPSFLHY